MDFKTLLKELELQNLPKDQFAIGSSGPLAVRKIREANDLDVLVSNRLWNQLRKTHEVIIGKTRPQIQISKNITLLADSHIKGFDSYTNDELIASAEVINGIKYVQLDIVAELKRKIGRDKDMKDIDLITKYNQNTNDY